MQRTSACFVCWRPAVRWLCADCAAVCDEARLRAVCREAPPDVDGDEERLARNRAKYAQIRADPAYLARRQAADRDRKRAKAAARRSWA